MKPKTVEMFFPKENKYSLSFEEAIRAVQIDRKEVQGKSFKEGVTLRPNEKSMIIDVYENGESTGLYNKGTLEVIMANELFRIVE